jgi:hypothetical protein
MLPPKAESVDAAGARDGFEAPRAFRAEVVGPGFTRLVVSSPPDDLAAIHQALVRRLEPPFRVLYQRLTDRSTGQLQKPEHHIAVEVGAQPVLEALAACAPLVYHDGRHQLWIEGRHDAKIVLEETGVIYVYPDDLSFRDALEEHGVQEGDDKNVGDCDYVRVNFLAEADALESELVRRLRLQRWERG